MRGRIPACLPLPTMAVANYRMPADEEIEELWGQEADLLEDMGVLTLGPRLGG